MEKRAERHARELGMGPGDQARLVDFIQQAVIRRDELMALARDSDDVVAATRANLKALRAWSSIELNRSFGAQLGARLEGLLLDLIGP